MGESIGKCFFWRGGASELSSLGEKFGSNDKKNQKKSKKVKKVDKKLKKIKKSQKKLKKLSKVRSKCVKK